MKESIILQRLPSSRGCFICGTENPIGLRLQFMRTETGVEARLRPALHFQGFGGVLQGGVSAGLLDDAMWHAIFGSSGAVTMTVELNVRYKAPVPVETDLVVRGAVVDQRRSLYTCSASIADTSGKVLAEATGKFMTAPGPIAERLVSEMS